LLRQTIAAIKTGLGRGIPAILLGDTEYEELLKEVASGDG
jgi:hypothetical protein